MLKIKRESDGIGYYEYPGYCDVCEKNTVFMVDTIWTTHTEGVTCSLCGFNSRYRNIYSLFMKEYKPGMKVYISEQVTPFFERVKMVDADIVGSEFMPSRDEADESMGHIRHEDVTSLRFEDNSFDIYISNDVFEHVFGYERAFSEASRILRKNGMLIFHVPFFFEETTSIRAEYSAEDGALRYFSEPVYHGNPVGDGTSLWVNDFGWDMFDHIRKAGFTEAYAIFRNDVTRGFLNTSALAFVAKK